MIVLESNYKKEIKEEKKTHSTKEHCISVINNFAEDKSSVLFVCFFLLTLRILLYTYYQFTFNKKG